MPKNKALAISIRHHQEIRNEAISVKNRISQNRLSMAKFQSKANSLGPALSLRPKRQDLSFVCFAPLPLCETIWFFPIPSSHPLVLTLKLQTKPNLFPPHK